MLGRIPFGVRPTVLPTVTWPFDAVETLRPFPPLL